MESAGVRRSRRFSPASVAARWEAEATSLHHRNPPRNLVEDVERETTEYAHMSCGIDMYMKAIQVTLDDALLARLDRDDEVKRDGRSAVLRRAADLYLRQRRRRTITEAYRRAYGNKAGAGDDLEGWSNEGVWPPE